MIDHHPAVLAARGEADAAFVAWLDTLSPRLLTRAGARLALAAWTEARRRRRHAEAVERCLAGAALPLVQTVGLAGGSDATPPRDG